MLSDSKSYLCHICQPVYIESIEKYIISSDCGILVME